MTIYSFATDANELVYPAITICRTGYDPGLPKCKTNNVHLILNYFRSIY